MPNGYMDWIYSVQIIKIDTSTFHMAHKRKKKFDRNEVTKNKKRRFSTSNDNDIITKKRVPFSRHQFEMISK